MARKATNDPVAAANRKVLEEIARRNFEASERKAESQDIGLEVKPPEQASAADVLRDEWDKKAFGDVPTTTRTVYGPDPLVKNNPEFHDKLERYGQEGVAERFRELILQKGADACPDPVMKKGVRAAIAKFGLEETAKAFYLRVMRIPSREVEVETTDAIDPLIQNPMSALVDKYVEPGFAPKFLSDLCIKILGLRGYTIVKDEHGDPVRCGTLVLGVIPQEWADRRKQHWSDESESQLRQQEEIYYDRAARAVRDAGVSGVAPLSRGEMVTSDPRLNDDWLDETRSTGVKIGRE